LKPNAAFFDIEATTICRVHSLPKINV